SAMARLLRGLHRQTLFMLADAVKNGGVVAMAKRSPNCGEACAGLARGPPEGEMSRGHDLAATPVADEHRDGQAGRFSHLDDDARDDFVALTRYLVVRRSGRREYVHQNLQATF